jgi:hypothetical protein
LFRFLSMGRTRVSVLLTGDFIKDDHDQWWFLQLKSFEVTESCHRICRIVSEAVQVKFVVIPSLYPCKIWVFQAAEENSTPYEFRITLRALGRA